MDELRKKTMGEQIDGIDRISYLPENIIYHVMSFLPTKEVAKTSILSKRWQQMQAFYPNLDFDQTYFGEELIRDPRRCRGVKDCPDTEEKINKFIKFVDDTLLRFREQGLRIWKFKLFVTIVDSTMDSLVDRWIGLATECNVEELDLQFQQQVYTWYTLPQTIFSAKSIKVLELTYCKLEQPLYGGSIRFRSLRKLSLESVAVDVQVIENIISSCPLIEEFVLHRCPLLKKVQLLVQGYDEVETVKIEEPSLKKFYYCYSPLEISPCNFNLVACQNLKVLCLTRVIIADKQFNDLICGFPLLEALCLLDCDLLERIKIPNKCLKQLVLHCYKLKEVEIDAPNLHSLQYDGNLMPSITSTSSSGQWEADLSLRPDDHLNTQWFHRMRDLLANSKHFKALTLSIHCLKTTFNVEELRGISVPSIDALVHLNLYLLSSSISYSDLLDGLLWSCQPETLFIEFKDLESRNKFLKVLHEKIVHKFDLNCCYLRRIKCWQHSLKDIESYDGYGKPLCWNTLSDNLPNSKNHQEKEMRITFKW